MTAVKPPSKVTLDAETDQALALFRDYKPQLAAGIVPDLAPVLAGGMADQIREQFGPGMGRVVMAVVLSLGSLEKVMREDYGQQMPATVLLAIAALAAAKLEGEAAK